MFKLVKMNMFRLLRTKSYYIIFGVLALFVVMTLYMAGDMMNDESGLMKQFGIDANHIEFLPVLDVAFKNGLLPLLIAIAISVFTCLDYSSGYIKNIASGVNKKSNIAFASFITWAIGSLTYFIGVIALTYIFGTMFIGSMAIGDVGEIVAYTSMMYFMMLSIVAMMVMVTNFFRSSAASITFAVVILQFSPLIYDAIKSFTKIDVKEFSVISNFTSLPMRFSEAWNTVSMSGTILLILFLGCAGFVMKKKDI